MNHHHRQIHGPADTETPGSPRLPSVSPPHHPSHSSRQSWPATATQSLQPRNVTSPREMGVARGSVPVVTLSKTPSQPHWVLHLSFQAQSAPHSLGSMELSLSPYSWNLFLREVFSESTKPLCPESPTPPDSESNYKLPHCLLLSPQPAR